MVSDELPITQFDVIQEQAYHVIGNTHLLSHPTVTAIKGFGSRIFAIDGFARRFNHFEKGQFAQRAAQFVRRQKSLRLSG